MTIQTLSKPGIRVLILENKCLPHALKSSRKTSELRETRSQRWKAFQNFSVYEKCWIAKLLHMNDFDCIHVLSRNLSVHAHESISERCMVFDQIYFHFEALCDHPVTLSPIDNHMFRVPSATSQPGSLNSYQHLQLTATLSRPEVAATSNLATNPP